jgi:hypothetical protein
VYAAANNNLIGASKDPLVSVIGGEC